MDDIVSCEIKARRVCVKSQEPFYQEAIILPWSCAPTIAVGEIHVSQRYDKILKRLSRFVGSLSLATVPSIAPIARVHSSSIVPRLVRSFCLPNRLCHRSAANSFTKVLRKSSSQESDNNDKNLKCLSYMTDVFRVMRNFAIY
eukprot:g32057.t1